MSLERLFCEMITFPYPVYNPRENRKKIMDFDLNNNEMVSDIALLSYNDCINLQAVVLNQNRGARGDMPVI